MRGGLQAIYLSGWQVAADANLAGQTYPDQCLYPANSVPAVVRRINNALLRADQIDHSDGTDRHRLAGADRRRRRGRLRRPAERLRADEVDDRRRRRRACTGRTSSPSEKKCGHMGGKVLVPTAQHVRTLNAARLAADISGVPTLVIARTDALAADLITSDVDPSDQPFLTGERTAEGFYRVRSGLEPCSPGPRPTRRTADLIWVETGTPDLGLAREFADRAAQGVPRTRCSPTTARRRSTGAASSDDDAIAKFQRELGELGYKFQFITLAGFHALNHSMFDLAHGYAKTA